MDIQNPAFTGFFNEEHKRVDLVLVVNDVTSKEMEDIRINFLMNAVKFGLELELEQGKLPEHKSLIFIKVHAPNAIIEEFGLYFNERKFFKDSHTEFINPSFNFLGMQHERELIKIIRSHYPGPNDYSTLERSKIVYQIFLQLRFGQHENHFGINKLIKRNIILDSFALHDGPYFIPPKQESSKYVNARQTLFYNWTGVINIWKTQPIHMIKEYLGERVAFYFSYYEYFNTMLIIISAIGAWIALAQYYENPQYDIITQIMCEQGVYKLHHDQRGKICNECRNFTICPLITPKNYCNELKLINRIDTQKMYFYVVFVTIWGLTYAILWKKRERYLLWIWEVNEKYIKKLTRPEYESHTSIYKKAKRTGLSLEYQSNVVYILRGFLLLSTAAIFSVWVFGLIVLSVNMCYFKHWYRYMISSSMHDWKRDEHVYIGMAALMYTSITFVMKIIAIVLSYIVTEFEKHKTYESYDRSLAVKLYAFCFACTFTLLICYTFVGELFFTHLMDISNFYTLGGYAMLNNGFGTSLDDICVTLAVIVVVDQIIFKIPTFFYNNKTDYNQAGIFDTDIPCWEREYKLPNLTESFIHNNYNAIAIQFALATLYSCTFPLAPLFILLINIWDIRHKARIVLLGHRRPLLLNSSGPSVWHYLILITAHFVPMLNVAVIVYQSRLLRLKFAPRPPRKVPAAVGRIVLDEFLKFKEYAEQYKTEKERHYKYWRWTSVYCATLDGWMDDSGKNIHEPSHAWWHRRSYKMEFLLFCEAGLILLSLIIHFLLSTKSNDIQNTVKMEKRIKQKFYIRKGFVT